MNKKSILDASAAMDNLEENSLKLSIVNELNALKEDLGVLKGEVKKAQEINQDGNKELSKFTKAVEEVQDKLAQEIRVRITEGAAEQNSRLKDANEKITSLDAKLENLKMEVSKATESLEGSTICNQTKSMKNSFRSETNRTFC